MIVKIQIDNPDTVRAMLAADGDLDKLNSVFQSLACNDALYGRVVGIDQNTVIGDGWKIVVDDDAKTANVVTGNPCPCWDVLKALVKGGYTPLVNGGHMFEVML